MPLFVQRPQDAGIFHFSMFLRAAPDHERIWGSFLGDFAKEAIPGFLCGQTNMKY